MASKYLHQPMQVSWLGNFHLFRLQARLLYFWLQVRTSKNLTLNCMVHQLVHKLHLTGLILLVVSRIASLTCCCRIAISHRASNCLIRRVVESSCFTSVGSNGQWQYHNGSGKGIQWWCKVQQCKRRGCAILVRRRLNITLLLPRITIRGRRWITSRV